MSFIRTSTGRNVSLLTPDPATIAIEDIAWALAGINRYSGQTRHRTLRLNVACHSLNVVRQLGVMHAEPGTQLLGLLHDAHEAYTGDITSPVRQVLRSAGGVYPVEEMSARLDSAIRVAFNLQRFTYSFALQQVEKADAQVLAAEWRDWMAGPCPVDIEPAAFAIKPRGADRAEQQFLSLFARLNAEAGLVPST